MVRIVSSAGALVVAGGMAVGSLGFAGFAAAAPTCTGSVPAPTSHKTFANGPASATVCADAEDTGTSSMAKIAGAGSYSNGSSTFTATPQKTT